MQPFCLLTHISHPSHFLWWLQNVFLLSTDPLVFILFFFFSNLLSKTGLPYYEFELPKCLGSWSLAPGTRLWQVSGGRGHQCGAFEPFETPAGGDSTAQLHSCFILIVLCWGTTLTAFLLSDQVHRNYRNTPSHIKTLVYNLQIKVMFHHGLEVKIVRVNQVLSSEEHCLGRRVGFTFHL